MREPIVIIGGGTIGLSIAEHLVRRGVQPVVLDRQDFAREASWASSGFLDLRVASERGPEFFELCRRSLELYGPWAARIREASGIDPEYLHSRSIDLAFEERDHQFLREQDALLASYGVQGTWLTGDEVRELEPRVSEELEAGYLLEHPHQIRPPRLNQGLLTVLRQKGARLMDHAEVFEIRREGGRVTEVRTGRGSFEVGQLVVAAGPWSSQLVAPLGLSLPVKPVRGQALMLRSAPGTLSHILFGYNWYVVPRLDGRTFVGSTVEDAGFVKGTTPFGLQKLTRLAVQTLPDLAAAPVEGTWSGLRPGTHDGLPYLGRMGTEEGDLDNLWMASGHYTHGLVLAPVTGHLFAQALLGEEPELSLAPFAPDRDPAQPNRLSERAMSF